jgi:hypothetical protein
MTEARSLVFRRPGQRLHHRQVLYVCGRTSVGSLAL